VIKVLVMGLPNSGKSLLAKALHAALIDTVNATWLNEDDIHAMYDDWDFSDTGRWHQAVRMARLARLNCGSLNAVAILDFACLCVEYRHIVQPDILVYMNTGQPCPYPDTAVLFVPPSPVEATTFLEVSSVEDIPSAVIVLRKSVLSFVREYSCHTPEQRPLVKHH